LKSKLSTYLLIAAVVGIWGTIIYKIISGINPVVPELTTNQNIAEFNPKPIAQNESFTISDVERDPFLGTLQKKNKPQLKRVINTVPKQSVNVPTIKYSGIVKKGNDQVFILTINGKQYLMRKGQTLNEVKLLSGTSKQVVVRFNNANSTILVD